MTRNAEDPKDAGARRREVDARHARQDAATSRRDRQPQPYRRDRRRITGED